MDNTDHRMTIPTRLPTAPLVEQPIPVTALQRLGNADTVTLVVERTQSLLAQIETSPEPVPEPVLEAAAKLHVALMGPGASDLDLRPGSLEIVGDEALHVRAVAEKKAQAIDADRRREEARAALPEDVRAKVVEYDTREDAHREALANAYDEGIIQGRFEARTEHDATPLWRIAWARVQARWSRWRA